MTTRHMPADGKFRKSTFSGKPGVWCLEVARMDEDTFVLRDSKDPDGPTIHLTKGDWDAHVLGVQAGEFNS